MACFDDLMLLSGGRCVYCGPWQASMSYFQSVGWPCPMYTNPADFYLAMTKEAGGLLAKKWASVKAWDRDLKQAQESPGMLRCSAFASIICDPMCQSVEVYWQEEIEPVWSFGMLSRIVHRHGLQSSV